MRRWLFRSLCFHAGTALLLIVLWFCLSSASYAPAQASSCSSANYPLSRDPRVLVLARGMLFFTNVPATLPPNGVALQGGLFLLKPLTQAQRAQVMITADDALSSAKAQGIGANGAKASPPILVSFTAVDTVPIPGDKQPIRTIQDRPVWLISYTSPQPFELPSFGPPERQYSSRCIPLYSHLEVAFDARTGAFVLGFDLP